ncbi:MAG: MFS transporter [Burkholderiaceae bacterium]|nr:MFS transporter [Burkholderiaceae bacterium]
MSSQQPTPPVQGSAHTRRELLLAMTGLASTVVIAAFDSTIVSTTLPRVAQALDGMGLYAWVGTGYFLASAVAILIFGRLGDLFGRKSLMLASIAIISVGAGLAALSQTMSQLIAFRVLQGIGNGMMTATAFAAPADLFPDPKRRVRWMAMLSASFAVASGVGPVLGGAVTQALGWRAAFLVTPITGIIALYLLKRHFPDIRPEHDARQRTIDWAGAALLTLAVGAPLAGLELLVAGAGGIPVGWAIALLLAGFASALLLIPVERRAATPIFPLHILRPRQSQLLNLAGMLTGAVMFILIFYIPLLLQDVLGYSPTHAGLLMTPMVACMPLGSIVNGRAFPRLAAPQRLMMVGSALLAAGCGMAIAFSASSPTWWVLLALSLAGFGLGFLLPNFTLFMQMQSPRQDVGVASALIQTTRALGSAVGTALVGMAIAHGSISVGLRISLVVCVALCGAVAWLASKIQMKNT